MSFFRRRPAEVRLTDEAYQRWLRARSPQPLAWFLSLGDDEQEALAMHGDAYVQDVCLGIGYAVKDPVLAKAGLDATSRNGSEAGLLENLAQAAARRAREGSNGMTLGGVAKRREAAQTARQRAEDAGKSLLGRKPDSVEGSS